MFSFVDGASVSCSADDRDGNGTAGYSLPLPDDMTTTTISAAPGTRWSLSSAYSTRTPTGWAVNARGQTYGVMQDDGSTPDLVAVLATGTGSPGYVYASDLLGGAAPTSPEEALALQATRPPLRSVPVYSDDGTTVIGRFDVG